MRAPRLGSTLGNGRRLSQCAYVGVGISDNVRACVCIRIYCSAFAADCALTLIPSPHLRHSMSSRMDAAKQAGCDGVELDNIDVRVPEPLSCAPSSLRAHTPIILVVLLPACSFRFPILSKRPASNCLQASLYINHGPHF